MVDDVVTFEEVDRSQVELVGGKGAHLGELFALDGVRVPDGFCVTTAAFDRVVAAAPSVAGLLGQLEQCGPGDHDGIALLSAELREAVDALDVPDDLATAVGAALAVLGDGAAYAVRSSATAEDLPDASFAGQQDSFLHVVGPASVIDHVRRCWASLFTERAVAYRMHHGIDHRSARMAVVVQRMVEPRVSGVLFTAEPVTSNRRIATVEATVGPGDALVAGLVDADAYQVRDDREVTRVVDTEASRPRLLRDDEVVRLVALGRRIEAHLGGPQDIEWCLVGDDIEVVQSRPITTLFPVPVRDDAERHVYVSVGHQQMMTDPMKPLGRSLFQLTALRPMYEAAGRLFVDITDALASPASRAAMIAMLGRSDPLIGDALSVVLASDDDTAPPSSGPPSSGPVAAPPIGAGALEIEPDPSLVDALIERTRASVADARRTIEPLQGIELIDAILADLPALQRGLADPQSMPVIMGAVEAAFWLNEHIEEWLGERQVADVLTQSVPHDVTAEMGLALLDVADAVRPHPEVIAFLRSVDGPDFLDQLTGLDGGTEVSAAIEDFLERYGMRCVGEIDITRPRWSERPDGLIPVILADVEHFTAGEASRRFEEGRRRATRAAHDVVERLRALPDGAAKADEAQRMIDVLRTFTGYREYPKYGMICRYAVYRSALTAEAARLVRAGVLARTDDMDHLTIQELREVVRTRRADAELIARRRVEHAAYLTLTPPRVLTSDGEAVAGSYRREDAPDGALVGLAVSSGVVEGRARVLRDISDGDVEAGDILVTTFTDPSWSPLFVVIGGLITEVGGLMTHGAVVAREYGLPAVVGVQDATRVISDGQRIRLHGTDGYVELLD